MLIMFPKNPVGDRLCSVRNGVPLELNTKATIIPNKYKERFSPENESCFLSILIFYGFLWWLWRWLWQFSFEIWIYGASTLGLTSTSWSVSFSEG